jgi:hypothetical protein
VLEQGMHSVSLKLKQMKRRKLSKTNRKKRRRRKSSLLVLNLNKRKKKAKLKFKRKTKILSLISLQCNYQEVHIFKMFGGNSKVLSQITWSGNQLKRKSRNIPNQKSRLRYYSTSNHK